MNVARFLELHLSLQGLHALNGSTRGLLNALNYGGLSAPESYLVFLYATSYASLPIFHGNSGGTCWYGCPPDAATYDATESGALHRAGHLKQLNTRLHRRHCCGAPAGQHGPPVHTVEAAQGHDKAGASHQMAGAARHVGQMATSWEEFGSEAAQGKLWQPQTSGELQSLWDFMHSCQDELCKELLAALHQHITDFVIEKEQTRSCSTSHSMQGHCRLHAFSVEYI